MILSASVKRQIKAHATIIGEAARAMAAATKDGDMALLRLAMLDVTRSIGAVEALLMQSELDGERPTSGGSAS